MSGTVTARINRRCGRSSTTEIVEPSLYVHVGRVVSSTEIHFMEYSTMHAPESNERLF